MADFSGEGKIWLEGEAMGGTKPNAVYIKDQEVVVTNLVGLVLEVKPVSERGTGRLPNYKHEH